MTDLNAKVKTPKNITLIPIRLDVEQFIEDRSKEKQWSKNLWLNNLVIEEMKRHEAAQS